MDNLSFGLSMTVVGMGGTLLSLGALAMLMWVLKRLFPAKPGQAAGGGEANP